LVFQIVPVRGDEKPGGLVQRQEVVILKEYGDLPGFSGERE
jgi:hypothetical protein